ncbi:hypothetical protein BHM03_00046255 [Ensete ventricosum]|uniref:Uncharacterized protein n=1 Tax=Ensete ventricosum TaxID=4639 RepID=A0A426Z2H8_ENSVE|nr:hypothetical protein B296_00023590 [Ensete ventricosum]RZS14564.1 hypothetical protein BHM03_00046255 [Ensete ventricosum]
MYIALQSCWLICCSNLPHDCILLVLVSWFYKRADYCTSMVRVSCGIYAGTLVYSSLREILYATE